MARPKTLTDETKKSARVSLLMTQQMLCDVTKIAQIKKVSLNDLFISLAAQVVKKNRGVIDNVNATLKYAADKVNLQVVVEGGDSDED